MLDIALLISMRRELMPSHLTVAATRANMNPMTHSISARRCLPTLGALALYCVALSVPGFCGTVRSYTGNLPGPDSTVLLALNLAAPGDVTLQSYGFGGGTNAAGTTIAPGGFDPFAGLFSGSGDTAIFIDGTSDILTTFSPGCPPAGLVAIGNVPDQCGDVNLMFAGLAAGSYTVLLSDGAYLPNAVFEAPGGTLGDGFTDLTGGVFQTCVDQNDCNSDTANWALDITTPSSSSVPEPGSATLALLGITLAMAAATGRSLLKSGDSK
jgi:hypothetical protein